MPIKRQRSTNAVPMQRNYGMPRSVQLRAPRLRSETSEDNRSRKAAESSTSKLNPPEPRRFLELVVPPGAPTVPGTCRSFCNFGWLYDAAHKNSPVPPPLSQPSLQLLPGAPRPARRSKNARAALRRRPSGASRDPTAFERRSGDRAAEAQTHTRVEPLSGRSMQRGGRAPRRQSSYTCVWYSETRHARSSAAGGA